MRKDFDAGGNELKPEGAAAVLGGGGDQRTRDRGGQTKHQGHRIDPDTTGPSCSAPVLQDWHGLLDDHQRPRPRALARRSARPRSVEVYVHEYHILFAAESRASVCITSLSMSDRSVSPRQPQSVRVLFVKYNKLKG